MEQLPQLSDDEFEHIEETIARSAKGRAFLRRCQRRAMGAAHQDIRTMLHEFRESWQQHTEAIEAANRVAVLRRELMEMAASIEQARREVAALRPEDSDDNRILTATNELDAIVISTERASNEILNAAERMMEVASRLRQNGGDAELAGQIESDVNAIFTACSFQDLTGQRTSKVINALRYIEQRITAMIGIWGIEGVTATTDTLVDQREDAHLLSGPQLDGMGVSQSDVDRMFGGAASDLADDDWDLPVAAPKPAAKPQQSQSDIDALFDVPAPAAKPQQDQSDIDALFDAPPPAAKPPAAKPQQSQSDIDALFDAPPPAAKPPAAKPKHSQSDIDALFDGPPPAAKPPAAPAKPPAAKPAPAAAVTPAAKAKPKPPAPPAEPAGGPLDQSAIDALFG
ncbi:MAG: hypothetical protein GC191_17350 [Azospirillum sp.]|nr:hypothetical protein [Azospirillum sp.]